MTDHEYVRERITHFSVDVTEVFDRVVGTDFATNQEIRATVALIRRAPLATAELAEVSGLRRRRLNRLLANLTAEGLVERSPAPHDRRLQVVHLTRLGRQRARELSLALAEYFMEARPLAAQLSTACGGARDDEHESSYDPLDLIDRMADVGTRLDRTIRDHEPNARPRGRQRTALLLIATQHLSRPSSLAAGLHLTSAGATYVLDQLESDGLITRRRDPNASDRRTVVVELTDAGRTSVRAVDAGIEALAPELAELFAIVAWRTAAPSIRAA